jgi:hypothetical protein
LPPSRRWQSRRPPRRRGRHRPVDFKLEIEIDDDESELEIEIKW